MTELWEPLDERDARLSLGASGLLADFNRSGVLTSAAVHVARRTAALAGDHDERVLLATALAVRAVTQGSVGADLARVAEIDPDLPWPAHDGWVAAVDGSALLAHGVLRHEHGLVYLDRYHRLEVAVRDDLLTRAAYPSPPVDQTRANDVLARIFPSTEGPDSADYTEQRAAARAAVAQWTTVITGGPGTGKTTTVAGLLAVLHDQARSRGESLSVAVTAPTGKAAARLQESILAELAGDDGSRFTPDDHEALAGTQSMTLHRLLGWVRDNNTRFRHDRANRLGHDVVIVDESSMVDLMLMARLLEAVRPDARLVLVGDPHQLTSVGAGAVLADVVKGFAERPDSPVCALRTNHRYGPDIAGLAEALRDGDGDRAVEVLRRGSESVTFVEVDGSEAAADALRADLLTTAHALRAAGLAGDAEAALAALDEHRLICAHRDGPHGVAHWNHQVERWLAEESGVDHWPLWYAGRPLLVTSNDYGLGIYNGESGAVVRRPDGVLRGVINGSRGALDFAPSRLADVETMHALTVHKSQGSQAQRITVLLPPEDSRLLTRELFYTAVTRAQQSVRVVGSEAEVRAAVARQATRATGLAQRLTDPN